MRGFEEQVPFKGNCFELLGFDIMIDSQLEAWLIEVNMSPSLGCDSPLDQRVKGNLVSDLFTLTGVVPLDRRQTQFNQTMKKAGTYGSYAVPIAGQPQKRDKSKKKKQDVAAADKAADKANLARNQAEAIKDTELEFKRRGGFKRIFPNIDYQYYKQFFSEERPLNAIVDAKVMEKRRLTTENTNALKQKIQEKKMRDTFSGKSVRRPADKACELVEI